MIAEAGGITFINSPGFPQVMAPKKKAVKTSRVKRKDWIPIVAPTVLNSSVLGEAPVLEAQQLVGRKLKVNLMSVTNDIKKQNINVSFKVEAIKEKKAHTSLVGFDMIPSSMRRLVRRGRSRVDDVLTVTTKDGKKVALKVILVTTNTVHKSIMTALRAGTRTFLQDIAKKVTFESLAKDVLNHRLQNDMKKKIAVTYPLRTCEIRGLRIVGEVKKEDVKKAEVKEPEVKKEEVKKETKEVTEEKTEE